MARKEKKGTYKVLVGLLFAFVRKTRDNLNCVWDDNWFKSSTKGFVFVSLPSLSKAIDSLCNMFLYLFIVGKTVETTLYSLYHRLCVSRNSQGALVASWVSMKDLCLLTLNLSTSSLCLCWEKAEWECSQNMSFPITTEDRINTNHTTEIQKRSVCPVRHKEGYPSWQQNHKLLICSKVEKLPSSWDSARWTRIGNTKHTNRDMGGSVFVGLVCAIIFDGHRHGWKRCNKRASNCVKEGAPLDKSITHFRLIPETAIWTHATVCFKFYANNGANHKRLTLLHHLITLSSDPSSLLPLPACIISHPVISWKKTLPPSLISLRIYNYLYFFLAKLLHCHVHPSLKLQARSD